MEGLCGLDFEKLSLLGRSKADDDLELGALKLVGQRV